MSVIDYLLALAIKWAKYESDSYTGGSVPSKTGEKETHYPNEDFFICKVVPHKKQVFCEKFNCLPIKVQKIQVSKDKTVKQRGDVGLTIAFGSLDTEPQK